MSKKSECEARAVAVIAARRENAQARAAEIQDRIFRECPQAEKLTDDMRKNMSRLFATFNDKSRDDALFTECRQTAAELRKRREEVLNACGYSEKDFEVKYTCPLCEDTGAVGDKICVCFKKALSEEYLKASNLYALKDSISLSRFRTDYYPGEGGQKMAQMLTFAKKYVQDFSMDSMNMLFTGNPGCGKTFFSCAIGFGLIDRGRLVLYTPIQDMISTFEAAQFSRDDTADTDIYTTADLLIIDDLGTEFKTQFADTVLYNVINTRLVRRLPFIVSTNLSIDGIRERYHERLTSRLVFEALAITFPAVDIRFIRKTNQKDSKG